MVDRSGRHVPSSLLAARSAVMELYFIAFAFLHNMTLNHKIKDKGKTFPIYRDSTLVVEIAASPCTD
jgi:hypothetical protein